MDNLSAWRTAFTHETTDVSPFLDQNQAAAYLHRSPRTLERYRVAGIVPKFVKAGRMLYRISVETIVGSSAPVLMKHTVWSEAL